MIYEAQCKKCSKVHDYFASVADADKKSPKCCGRKTKRGIHTPPMVAALSTQTGWKNLQLNGQHFATGDQMKKYIKQKDLVPADEGAARAQQAIRNRKQKYKKQLRADVVTAVNRHM